MTPKIEIAEGADAQVAAAIAAVVAQLLAEEAAMRASPLLSPEQSSWVQAGRMRQKPLVSRPGTGPADWSQFTLSRKANDT